MNDTLSRAHELIEADQMSQAREILESFLARERNNADAWWLYAHAVANIDEAQTALANVKRIAPDYPGVDDLIVQMNDRLAILGEGSQIQEFPEGDIELEDDAFEPDFDDIDFPEDEFDLDFDEEDDDDPEPEIVEYSRWQIFAVIGLVLIIAVVAIIILLSGNGRKDEPVSVDLTPTTVAGVPTSQPTEPFVAASVTLLDVLNSFDLESNEIDIVETQLGQTSFVSICADSATFRDTLTNALITIGRSNITVDTDGIGVRLIDCTSNQTLNSIVVPSSSVQAFSSGSLTEDQFRREWKAAELVSS